MFYLNLVWVPAPSHAREEGSGNTAILVLCQRNVGNVVFTTLLTATLVAENQYHRAKVSIIIILTPFHQDVMGLSYSFNFVITMKCNRPDVCDKSMRFI